jgi:hypothetical protein
MAKGLLFRFSCFLAFVPPLISGSSVECRSVLDSIVRTAREVGPHQAGTPTQTYDIRLSIGDVSGY